MVNDEILKRLEEIEAQCAAMREALERVVKVGVGQTDASFSHMTSEDCSFCEEKDEIAEAALAENEAGRTLLERLHRLEAVAEAAREALQWFQEFGYNRWGIAVQDDFPDHEPILRSLKTSLVALEEEK